MKEYWVESFGEYGYHTEKKFSTLAEAEDFASRQNPMLETFISIIEKRG